MKNIYSLLVLLLASVGLYAQTTYPVQVNVNLVPPYSLYLDDYATGARERLSVTLVNRDVQRPSTMVRLKLTIKANGFTITSNDYAPFTPITIEPNMPYRLSQEELAQYFNPQNLTAGGTGSLAWQKDRKLPEGMIEFCFEAIEQQTGRKLSLPGCGMAWVSTQKPPTLSLPFNGETVQYRDPLNLLFQWTPRHSGLANVEYQLIIKQLWDNGLKPEAAWAYSTEILRETVKPTSLLYGVTMPPLTPGMRYAWAVQAIAKDGFDEVRVFENNGLSEIRWFTLADYCPPPAGVTAKADNGRISLEWVPLPEHIDFTVSYRKKGVEGAEWFYTKTNLPRLTLYDVQPGYTYEYRIGSACKPETPIYGDTYTIAIPAVDTSYNPSCGKLPAVDVSNQNRLQALAPGEMFMASDFPVYVTGVSGSNGTFSGEGYTIMPKLFLSAKLAVRWSNITINTDRRMVEGWVDGIYDEANSQIVDIEEYEQAVKELGILISGRIQALYDKIVAGIEDAVLADYLYNFIRVEIPESIEKELALIPTTDTTEVRRWQELQLQYTQQLANIPDNELQAFCEEAAKTLNEQRRKGELTKEGTESVMTSGLIKNFNPNLVLTIVPYNEETIIQTSKLYKKYICDGNIKIAEFDYNKLPAIEREKIDYIIRENPKVREVLEIMCRQQGFLETHQGTEPVYADFVNELLRSDSLTIGDFVEIAKAREYLYKRLKGEYMMAIGENIPTVLSFSLAGKISTPLRNRSTIFISRIALRNSVNIEKAVWAQKTFGPKFSDNGKFANRLIDDVLKDLKSGTLKVADIPIDVVVKNGETFILNTRSSVVLMKAGVPRSSWNVINRTGNKFFEELLEEQLTRNGLIKGVNSIRQSGTNISFTN